MELEQRVEALEKDLAATKGKTAIAIGIGLTALVFAIIQLMSRGL